MKEGINALLKELKIGLHEIYQDGLKALYLYGSYARGEEDEESDVDLMVVLDYFHRYGEEVDRTGHLISDLSLKYGVSVSRVFVSERNWKTRDSFLRMCVRRRFQHEGRNEKTFR